MILNNLSTKNNRRKSFTLIELLVVLALVAILSVVVILTLNPAELIKQARDSNRLSDLSTINTALNLFSADVTSGFTGTSTVVYVSLPDNASSTCGSLGLPALPLGYTYNCATTANFRNTNGTGWIPVNFQQISSNSPISQLPVDPINTTSTGNYYTYVSGGSWILTAIPESQKQKTELSANPQLSKYPGVIGMGNNLDLSPLYNPSGLVGYWKFDEGNGTIAKDSSGQGNDGVVSGTSIVSGKVGSAKNFDGVSGYVSVPTATSINFGIGNFSAAAWVKTSAIGLQYIFGKYDGIGGNGIMFYETYSPGPLAGGGIWNGSYDGISQGSTNIGDGIWHFATLVYTRGSPTKIYLDGIDDTVISGTSDSNTMSNSSPLIIGGYAGPNFNGIIDDVRLYNRALSAAEILALYNATK